MHSSSNHRLITKNDDSPKFHQIVYKARRKNDDPPEFHQIVYKAHNLCFIESQTHSEELCYIKSGTKYGDYSITRSQLMTYLSVQPTTSTLPANAFPGWLSVRVLVQQARFWCAGIF